MATSLRWPASLPQTLPLGTRVRTSRNVVQSETEFGPQKVRRRFTAAPKILEYPADAFILDDDQLAELLNFFENTTAGGSLSFMWDGPVPWMGDVEVRFGGEELVPEGIGGGQWAVETRFRVLP